MSIAAAASASPTGSTIPPPPPPAAYAEVVRRRLGNLGARILFEPGRVFVGNAGILVARVVYVKQGAAKTFVIVDAGMNDLIRPTLYDAHHDIRPVVQPDPQRRDDRRRRGRRHLRDRRLSGARPPPAAAGRPAICVAIMTAGAYGAVQGSTYNTRPLAAEVMVNGAEWAVVRPRQTYDELIGMDRIAPWLD